MTFPETRWTLISQLGDPAEVSAALDQLCTAYWAPIYAFLLQSGRNDAEAQDLTQDFLEMVVRQRLLERADPSSGRLRSWLLSALKNFLANARRFETRQKRGSGAYVFPLGHTEVISEVNALASEGSSPDEAFDRAWVAALMRRVLQTVGQQYRDVGKQREFEALLPWLLDNQSSSQIDAAADAGMTPATFRVQLYRLRARYRDTLRQEITATLGRDEDYNEEVEYLFRITGQKGL
jgi:RNA polymerase sigma-70 factor (ECF subfamily)